MAEIDAEVLAGMNQAAKEAEQELNDKMILQELCAWWSRWYLKAGHKRLGRILVKLNKERS